MSVTSKSDNIAALTGVRGLAAMWVVFYHIGDAIRLGYPDRVFMNQVFAGGYLGVDLFALLSGFIIAYTYGERLAEPSRARAIRYVWLRFVRTYPLHLFALLVLLAAAVTKEGMSAFALALQDATFWRQIFLVHGLGVEDQFAWNAPSWSLSSEWACYLLFPLLAPWIARVKSGAVALGCAVATLGLTIVAMNAVGYQRFDAFLDYGWLRIGGEFFTGCWLCRVHQSRLLERWPLGWISLVAIVVLVLGLGFASWKTLAAYYVSVFAIAILALAQNRAPLRALLGNRAAVYLGEISYSVYMLHWLVLSYGKQLGFPSLSNEVRPFAIVAVVLVVASLSYHLVEQTSRRRLRDLVNP